MTYEFSILYYINLYKKYLKAFILVIGVAIFLAIFSTLQKPPSYVSSARLLIEAGIEPGTARLEGLFGIKSVNSLDILTAIITSRRMAQDINDKFKLQENPKLWWSVDTSRVMAGMIIEIKGPDPEFTQKVANFTIENIDKINTELVITTDKPMVKVLDPATYGAREPRGMLKKIVIAGMFSFLAFSAYIVFLDYFRKLKAS